MMKKLNRRSFLKSVGKAIGGVLGLGVVGLPKAKAVEKPADVVGTIAELISVERGVWTGIRFIETEDTIQEWEPAELSCIWRNRKFLFKGQRIKWSEEGEYDNFPECNYLDLPTVGEIWAVKPLDFGLVLGLWIGNKLWSLSLTRDELVIRVECLSKDSYYAITYN